MFRAYGLILGVVAILCGLAVGAIPFVIKQSSEAFNVFTAVVLIIVGIRIITLAPRYRSQERPGRKPRD